MSKIEIDNTVDNTPIALKDSTGKNHNNKKQQPSACDGKGVVNPHDELFELPADKLLLPEYRKMLVFLLNPDLSDENVKKEYEKIKDLLSKLFFNPALMPKVIKSAFGDELSRDLLALKEKDDKKARAVELVMAILAVVGASFPWIAIAALKNVSDLAPEAQALAKGAMGPLIDLADWLARKEAAEKGKTNIAKAFYDAVKGLYTAVISSIESEEVTSAGSTLYEAQQIANAVNVKKKEAKKESIKLNELKRPIANA